MTISRRWSRSYKDSEYYMDAALLWFKQYMNRERSIMMSSYLGAINRRGKKRARRIGVEALCHVLRAHAYKLDHHPLLEVYDAD